MNETFLKHEICKQLILTHPNIVICSHQDKVQKGIADTEIVFNGKTIWIEWKIAINKSTNELMRNQCGKHFLNQINFLQKRIRAGLECYLGVFTKRDTLILIDPMKVHRESKLNEFSTEDFLVIKRENNLWKFKTFIEGGYAKQNQNIHKIIINSADYEQQLKDFSFRKYEFNP